MAEAVGIVQAKTGIPDAQPMVEAAIRRGAVRCEDSQLDEPESISILGTEFHGGGATWIDAEFARKVSLKDLRRWMRHLLTEDGNASDYRTGAPGRPSSRHLVLEEHQNRVHLGCTAHSRAQEAAELSKWLEREHPGAPQLRPRSIGTWLPRTFRPQLER